MIIDSHCHLDYDNLYNQLDEVLKRAKLNNVSHLLTICTTLNSFERIKKITNKFENVYGTFGIHPHESGKYTEVDFEYIVKTINKNKKIIGVGETGLDFYYNHTDEVTQTKSFIDHISAAAELNIPIIVHSRNAENKTYDIIRSEKKNSNLKVLIHCFTGTNEFAKKLVDLGCYISVSGIITFKKSNVLSDVVSNIPIKNLLVETDSPYLSPDPHRGKSNEPSFIIHTIEKLAMIKNVSKEIISKNTTYNFKKLFNLN